MLWYERRRPKFHGSPLNVGIISCTEDDHLHLRCRLSNLSTRFETVQFGEKDIDDNHVRVHERDGVEEVGTIGCGRNDSAVGAEISAVCN